jgi:hypothetical protein
LISVVSCTIFIVDSIWFYLSPTLPASATLLVTPIMAREMESVVCDG